MKRTKALCFIFVFAIMLSLQITNTNAQVVVTDPNLTTMEQANHIETMAQWIQMAATGLETLQQAYTTYATLKQSTSFLDGLYNSAKGVNDILHSGGWVLDSLGILGSKDKETIECLATMTMNLITVTKDMAQFESDMQSASSGLRDASSKNDLNKELNELKLMLQETSWQIRDAEKVFKLAAKSDSNVSMSQYERIQLTEHAHTVCFNSSQSHKAMAEKMSNMRKEYAARKEQEQGNYSKPYKTTIYDDKDTKNTKDMRTENKDYMNSRVPKSEQK